MNSRLRSCLFAMFDTKVGNLGSSISKNRLFTMVNNRFRNARCNKNLTWAVNNCFSSSVLPSLML
jgi:hypothetical protein